MKSACTALKIALLEDATSHLFRDMTQYASWGDPVLPTARMEPIRSKQCLHSDSRSSC